MRTFSAFLSNRRRLFLILAASAMVAILVSVAAALYFSGSKEQAVAVLAKDEIVILRTPGGMLEVSTLIRNEVFQWSTEYTCLPLDCGKLFGKTISEVRVPVHYTYRIPLAAKWSLKLVSHHFELAVPKPEPKLPAAIDVKKLEIRTDKAWFSPDKTEHRESVVRNIGPEFDRRATQKNYLDAQREEARKTVVEFAQKWMLAQDVAANLRGYPIRVSFPDDPRPQ